MNKCENVSNIINTVTKILHIMCSKKKREKITGKTLASEKNIVCNSGISSKKASKANFFIKSIIHCTYTTYIPFLAQYAANIQ